MIYLNNAATTKPSRKVRKRTAELLEEMWMNPSSAEGAKVKEEIEKARIIIKEALSADEVIFTSGATEGNNIIDELCRRDLFYSSNIEHPSNRHDVHVANETINKHGFNIDYFEEKISSCENLLVSFIGINNETGFRMPIEKIGVKCKEHGHLLHIDGTQMLGHEHINMKEMNINYLTGSGHKFGALKGCGFIAYNGVKPIKSNIGGGQEHGFRSGTEDAVSIITMAEEFKWMNDHISENLEYIENLKEIMFVNLNSIDDIYYPCKGLKCSPYILNICFKDVNGEALVHLLNMKGVAVSSGSACHSGSIEPSYVLQAFEVPDEYIHGSIRISFSPENTVDEIIAASEIIIDCVKILRGMKSDD